MEDTKPNIKFPEEYKKSKNTIAETVNHLSKKGLTKITKYVFDDPFISPFIYLYLLKKYKSNCFLIRTKDSRNHLHIGVLFEIKPKYTEVELSGINAYFNKIADDLVDCIIHNINIIIIPLGLNLYFTNGEIDGHANVLIYRKEFNHIEHFEPHGQSFDDKEMNVSINLLLNLFIVKVNSILLKKTQIQNFTPITLINSTLVCPYLDGFQTHDSKVFKDEKIEGGGYCEAWSLFFTELCLKNPSMTSSEIITSVFDTTTNKSIRKHFRNIIRGYVTFMTEKMTKFLGFLIGNINISKITEKQINSLKKQLDILMDIEIELAFNPNALNEEINRFKSLINENPYKFDRLYLNGLSLELNVLERYKIHLERKGKGKSIQVNRVKVCPPGKELNTKTNRCNKVKTEKVKTEKVKTAKVKECPPGKELNTKTNRCNKIKVTKSVIMKTIKKKQAKLEKELLK